MKVRLQVNKNEKVRWQSNLLVVARVLVRANLFSPSFFPVLLPVLIAGYFVVVVVMDVLVVGGFDTCRFSLPLPLRQLGAKGERQRRA